MHLDNRVHQRPKVSRGNLRLEPAVPLARTELVTVPGNDIGPEVFHQVRRIAQPVGQPLVRLVALTRRVVVLPAQPLTTLTSPEQKLTLSLTHLVVLSLKLGVDSSQSRVGLLASPPRSSVLLILVRESRRGE